MWNPNDYPSWVNRTAHSACAVLLGNVLGSLLFDRGQLERHVALPAVVCAALYGVTMLSYHSARWLRGLRRAKGGA